MKTLLDFIPILLFFAAYKLHAWFGVSKDEAMFFATPVLMAATAAQMAIIYYLDRSLTTLQKVTLGMILVFGGITLALHDKRFVMWKPTVLYWLMGVGLLVSQAMGKQPLKSLMGKQLTLPEAVWRRLSLAWVAFFAGMGALNLYVAFTFSEEVWVNFKLFGGMGLMLLFVIGQSIVLSRYMEDPN